MTKKPKKNLKKVRKKVESFIEKRATVFIDKLTTNDLFNIAAFSSASVMTYSALEAQRKVAETVPKEVWLTLLASLSPALLPFVPWLLTQVTEQGRPSQASNALLAILAGYGVIKLPSIITAVAPIVSSPVS